MGNAQGAGEVPLGGGGGGSGGGRGEGGGGSGDGDAGRGGERAAEQQGEKEVDNASLTDDASTEERTQRFARLVEKGREDLQKLALVMADQIDGDLPAFVNYVLRNVPLRHALPMCAWLVCAGQGSPLELAQQVKAKMAGKSNVCGKIWNQGDMAYKCRHCGYDEPCAICVECFQEGNHQGHDYLLIQVGGGCCDCGDPLAWRPEGNCRNHVGNSPDWDPMSFFPPQVLNTARVVLKAVITFLGETLSLYASMKRDIEEERTPFAAVGGLNKKLEEVHIFAGALVTWLMQMFELFGDGMRRLACRVIDGLPALDSFPRAEELVPSQTFGTDNSGQQSLVFSLLLMDHLLEPDLRGEINKWYFQLFTDTTFKPKFARCFVAAYPFFADAYVRLKKRNPRSSYESLMSLSTQFFHPQLIPDLIERGGLVMMLTCKLYEILTSIFKQVEGDAEKNKEFEYQNPILKKRLYWFLCYDLRALTAGPDAALHVLFDRNTITGQLPQVIEGKELLAMLKLLRLLQRINPMGGRYVQAHVTDESQSWLHAFTLELELLLPLVHNIYEGILAADETIVHNVASLRWLQQFLAHISAPTLHNSAYLQGIPAEAIDPLVEASAAVRVANEPKLLRKASTTTLRRLPWKHRPLEVEHFEVGRRQADEQTGSSAAGTAAEGDISFQLPLHRLLVHVIYAVSERWGTTPLELVRALYPTTSQDTSNEIISRWALATIEHPMRIQALVAQVEAAIWVRNGFNMLQQARLYHEHVEGAPMFFADIGLFQMCAGILNRTSPDTFVPISLERFGLTSYFDWQQVSNEYLPGVELKQVKSVAEDFLRFLIIVVNDRTLSGIPLPASASGSSTEEETYRCNLRYFVMRETVHQLMTGPKSHSQIVKALPQRLTKHKNERFESISALDILDQTLEEVAEFSRPSGLMASGLDAHQAVGTYTLKETFWNQFDPYFPRFSQQELETAKENYAVVQRKRKVQKTQTLKSSNVGGVSLPKPILQPLPSLIVDGLAEILRSRALLAVVFSVLYHTTEGKKPKDATVLPSAERISDAMFNSVLTLLHLILQFRASNPPLETTSVPASGEAEEAQGIFDLVFPSSSDPLINICHIANLSADPKGKQKESESAPQAGKSILRMLLELQALKSDDLQEQREIIEDLLALAERADSSPEEVVRNTIRQFRNVAAGTEAEQEETEEQKRARKMQEARERQKAILAQFAAKQKAFIDQEGDKLEEETETPSDEMTAEDRNCVLCKEGAKPGDVLGRMAFVQHSNILATARRTTLARIMGTSALVPAVPVPAEHPKEEDQGSSSESAPVETASGSTSASPSSASSATDPEAESKKLKEKEYKEWKQELVRDLGDSGGAHCSTCGHFMHATCRHKYSMTLMQEQVRGIYSRGDQSLSSVAITNGTFRCPLCRSVANTLLPFDPSFSAEEFSIGLQSEGDEEWSAWLQEAAKANIPSSSESACSSTSSEVKQALQDFGARVYSCSRNIAQQSIEVALNIETAELSSRATHDARSKERMETSSSSEQESTWDTLAKAFANGRRIETLQAVIEAIIAHDRVIADINGARLADTVDTLHSLLLALPHTQEGEGPVAPLLQGDMFALFVRLFFLRAAGADARSPIFRWANLVRILYSAVVVQATITSAVLQTSTNSSSDELPQEVDREEADEWLWLRRIVGEAMLRHGMGMDWSITGRSESDAAFAARASSLTVPFLRRLTLFLQVTRGAVPPSSSLPPSQERRMLLSGLGLPTRIEELIPKDETSPMRRILRAWCEELFASVRSQSSSESGPGPSSRFESLFLLPSEQTFELSRAALPPLYYDLPLFKAPAQTTCKRCKAVPKNPTACLVCGQFLCMACPHLAGRMGELNLHAMQCNGGEGMFLLLRHTLVLLLRPTVEEGCFYNSSYIDDHAEEDVGLKRGRPLFLDPARYKQLRAMWLEHRLVQVINHASANTFRGAESVNWHRL